MAKTAAERSRCAIRDPREREAVCLLAAAGWTRSELAMTFQCSETTICRVIEATTTVGVTG